MISDADRSIGLEADRLLRDDTLTVALEAMRAEGLDRLLHADAADAHAVIRSQAYVAAIDAFRAELATYVARGTAQKARGGLA